LNPLLKESVVARAYQADPTAADAEYGGQFREPVTAYLSRELIERAVEPGITERPPLPGVQYVASLIVAPVPAPTASPAR